jgi:phospholipase C
LTTDARPEHDEQPARDRLTRRAFLAEGAGAVAATTLTGRLASHRVRIAPKVPLTEPKPLQHDALRVLGRSRMRLPNSIPNAALPVATDTMPEIEHVVVLMMENHSYDNFFGMLGRTPGQRPRGDGFTIAPDGYPDATNPYGNGQIQRAFRMPNTCQLHGKPSQEWVQSHVQYASGSNDGFVISNSGPVAMGYWDGGHLPFTYDLATHFPIGDRWFCSLLGQTDPNRRYLLAATSLGMTDDIGGSIGNLIPDVSLVLPANGTIFERLSGAGISWADYYTDFPTGTTMELFPTNDTLYAGANAKHIDQFFSDARAGSLPSFTLLDPNYGTQSQEDPQNVIVGEAFLAEVVNAIGSSPAWLKTMLIIAYDEHGGYYDHVPPPVALAPDGIGPQVNIGESQYDGFTRYGFRVPSVIVSPYAKRNYVSHVVYDHTSILAFLERKWNLPAMSYRDANANDLTDFLDLGAIAKGEPTFPELPTLVAAGDTAATLACSTSGPGTIPPPPPTPLPIGVKLRYSGRSRRVRGLVLELETTRYRLSNVNIELHHGLRRVATVHLDRLTTTARRVVLREHGHVPAAGRYTITIRHGGRTLVKRRVTVG